MLDRNQCIQGTVETDIETNNHRANTPSVCTLLKDSHGRQWRHLFFVVQGNETRATEKHISACLEEDFPYPELSRWNALPVSSHLRRSGSFQARIRMEPCVPVRNPHSLSHGCEEGYEDRANSRSSWLGKNSGTIAAWFSATWVMQRPSLGVTANNGAHRAMALRVLTSSKLSVLPRRRRKTLVPNPSCFLEFTKKQNYRQPPAGITLKF